MELIIPQVKSLEEDLKAIGLEECLNEGADENSDRTVQTATRSGSGGASLTVQDYPIEEGSTASTTRGHWRRMPGRERAEARARLRRTKAKRVRRIKILHRKPTWKQTTGKGQTAKAHAGVSGTRRRPKILRRSYAKLFGNKQNS